MVEEVDGGGEYQLDRSDRRRCRLDDKSMGGGSCMPTGRLSECISTTIDIALLSTSASILRVFSIDSYFVRLISGWLDPSSPSIGFVIRVHASLHTSLSSAGDIQCNCLVPRSI